MAWGSNADAGRGVTNRCTATHDHMITSRQPRDASTYATSQADYQYSYLVLFRLCIWLPTRIPMHIVQSRALACRPGWPESVYTQRRHRNGEVGFVVLPLLLTAERETIAYMANIGQNSGTIMRTHLSALVASKSCSDATTDACTTTWHDCQRTAPFSAPMSQDVCDSMSQ
jgi:hypothetical protein